MIQISKVGKKKVGNRRQWNKLHIHPYTNKTKTTYLYILPFHLSPLYNLIFIFLLRTPGWIKVASWAASECLTRTAASGTGRTLTWARHWASTAATTSSATATPSLKYCLRGGKNGVSYFYHLDLICYFFIIMPFSHFHWCKNKNKFKSNLCHP